MAGINILIAVDGAKIAELVPNGTVLGTKEKPHNVGVSQTESDVYISMISQSQYVSSGDGTSGLNISAKTGDTITWAMTTFGNNIDYTAFVYRGTFSYSNSSIGLLGTELLNVQTSEYLPNNSGTLTPYSNNIYIAKGTIVSGNVSIRYLFDFQLVDNTTGKVIGYFAWDPYIYVK